MARIGDDDKVRFAAFCAVTAKEQTSIRNALDSIYMSLLQNDSAGLAEASARVARHGKNLVHHAVTFSHLAESLHKLT